MSVRPQRSERSKLNQRWTSDEERALEDGVARHGAGKWSLISQDPDLAARLANRSTIDLKDKWRNVQKNRAKFEASGSGTGSRSKENRADVNARIDAMIFEALKTITNNDGSDVVSIINFVEQNHKLPLPRNFQKTVHARLKILVSGGKVGKVQNIYRLCERRPPRNAKEMPSPKPNVETATHQKPPDPPVENPDLTKAAEAAARLVAQAEEDEYLAAVAVDEWESASKLSEEADAVLQFATEIYKQIMKQEQDV